MNLSSHANAAAIVPGYLLLELGAARRLEMLRARAAASNKPDWRTARDWNLANWRDAFGDLAQGTEHGGEAVWYTHTGAAFRDERDADDIVPRLHHGWFTDDVCQEVARGVVGRLPHGRFVAGYLWTSNGERAYFDGVHDDEHDAALVADEHARVFAEVARADDERFQAMTRAEDAEAQAARQLRKWWPARHVSQELRQDVRELAVSLRERRDTLRAATRAYESV